MSYREQFEKEMGIDEFYDPFDTKEPGFYSEEYKNQFIQWLEQKLAERDRSINIIRDIMELDKGTD